MKLTVYDLKDVIREAIKEQLGSLDTADYYGPQDDVENVLELLDGLKLSAVRRGDRESARVIADAGHLLEKGDLKGAEQMLIQMFNKGGRDRAVYHAIAYIRDTLGK